MLNYRPIDEFEFSLVFEVVSNMQYLYDFTFCYALIEIIINITNPMRALSTKPIL